MNLPSSSSTKVVSGGTILLKTLTPPEKDPLKFCTNCNSIFDLGRGCRVKFVFETLLDTIALMQSSPLQYGLTGKVGLNHI